MVENAARICIVNSQSKYCGFWVSVLNIRQCRGTVYCVYPVDSVKWNGLYFWELKHRTRSNTIKGRQWMIKNVNRCSSSRLAFCRRITIEDRWIIDSSPIFRVLISRVVMVMRKVTELLQSIMPPRMKSVNRWCRVIFQITRLNCKCLFFDRTFLFD